MTRFDYEALLLNYTDNYADSSDDYLNIFVLMSVHWLRNTAIASVSPATVSSILEKMITTAEAMLCRSRRYTYGCRDAEDDGWIYQLWREREPLSASYGQLFRRLVHIFEMLYRQDALVGDQDMIRLWLHRCFERAHKERECEVEECHGIAHICDGTWESNYRECPLLAKEEGNVAGPSSALLSSQRARRSGANLNQTPSLAAFPEDTRLQDPNTTAIELSTPVSCPTGGTKSSSSLLMNSSDAQDASTSLRSPGTTSDIPFVFEAPLSPAGCSTSVAHFTSHAPSTGHMSSMALIISPSPGCPPTADGVEPSNSHMTGSPSCNAGESHRKDQGTSCGDITDPKAGADAVLSAESTLPVQQHEMMSLAATTTETEGAGSPGVARDTSNQVDTPEIVISYPTISTPLLVSSAPPATSIPNSQPPASHGGPLIDRPGSSRVEIRSPAMRMVSHDNSERESSQGPPTARTVAADESSREGRGLHAEREEKSRRSASSLFQGARVASRRALEEFELAVWNEHTRDDRG